jgi:hypothetical protein
MIRLGGLVSQKAFGKFEMGKVVSNPFATAFVNEAEGEDHEVSMANNSLDTIIKMATELKAKMGEDEKQIPAWIQDHIAKAENYISQASGNYHEYGDSNESVNEAPNKLKHTISKKEWSKIPKYNKHIGMDGVHYIMKYDDKIGTYLQGVQIVDESVNEASPCWKGYKQVGMKDKGGRQVPNCVPNESVVREANTISAPGKWVSYLSMARGKKLLKTFDTARGAKQYLSKNVDKLLGGANVESVGIMTKKEWDEREAKYAIEGMNEVTYNFGKEEYTKKNLTPTQIQDLAFGYVQTPITKLVGKTLGHRVNLANDLARLTGTKQLDAKARGKESALIMVLLKNKLVSKEEYIQMYKDLIEKHQQVIKYLKNASPEMRNSGGAARAAAKDMKGEFDMD